MSVLSGDDDMTLPIMALGALAWSLWWPMWPPGRLWPWWSAMARGDLDEARKLHYQLAPLVRAMFLETNPIPVKAACRLMGLAAGPLRLPLAPMSSG